MRCPLDYVVESGDGAAEGKLIELGEQLQAVHTRRAELMAQIRDAIREADQAGVPRSTISDLLGLSRQTVYDTLNQQR